MKMKGRNMKTEEGRNKTTKKEKKKKKRTNDERNHENMPTIEE
jgi:hypothetical protein